MEGYAIDDYVNQTLNNYQNYLHNNDSDNNNNYISDNKNNFKENENNNEIENQNKKDNEINKDIINNKPNVGNKGQNKLKDTFGRNKEYLQLLKNKNLTKMQQFNKVKIDLHKRKYDLGLHNVMDNIKRSDNDIFSIIQRNNEKTKTKPKYDVCYMKVDFTDTSKWKKGLKNIDLIQLEESFKRDKIKHPEIFKNLTCSTHDPIPICVLVTQYDMKYGIPIYNQLFQDEYINELILTYFSFSNYYIQMFTMTYNIQVNYNLLAFPSYYINTNGIVMDLTKCQLRMVIDVYSRIHYVYCPHIPKSFYKYYFLNIIMDDLLVEVKNVIQFEIDRLNNYKFKVQNNEDSNIENNSNDNNSDNNKSKLGKITIRNKK